VPNDKSINGATGSVTAGSLLIQYEDDKQQLIPGGSIQNSFSIALGGATASVDSSQGSISEGETPTEAAGIDNGNATSVAGPEIPPAGLGEIATPPSGLATTPRGGPAAVLPARLALNSFGLAWGLVLFAVLLALGLAFGLRRLTDDVFADAPAAATCPLEEPK
jgi:hypothetical protein